MKKSSIEPKDKLNKKTKDVNKTVKTKTVKGNNKKAIRGFEVVSYYKNNNINIPYRSTKYSAGYDFECPQDVVIPSFYKLLIKCFFKNLFIFDKSKKKKVSPPAVPTGIKAFFPNNEFLMICSRSSNTKKIGIVMPNAIGIIDSDYYNCADNEGLIHFVFFNFLPWDVKIKKGDRIGQGIFMQYNVTDGDNAIGTRQGGFGSTDLAKIKKTNTKKKCVKKTTSKKQ